MPGSSGPDAEAYLCEEPNKASLCEDLAALRNALYAKGIIPRARMSSKHTLRSIHWDSFGVYQAPENWQGLRNFCKIACVPWQAANIGTCVMRGAQNILKPKRSQILRKLAREIIIENMRIGVGGQGGANLAVGFVDISSLGLDPRQSRAEDDLAHRIIPDGIGHRRFYPFGC